MIKIISCIFAVVWSPVLLALYVVGFFKHSRTNQTKVLHHVNNEYVDCPSIKAGYQTNWLFTLPHINTAVSELFRVIRRRDIPEQYTFMLTNDDGGAFTIHVVGELQDDGMPTVVLFHGLCGGYYASYMQSFAYAFRKAGFRVVKVNARGCAEYKLNTPIYFCATHTKDHKMAIDTVAKMFPSSQLFGIGFSLGANILLHYLEENPNTPLTACIGFSVAFDIPACDKHLNTFIPKYTTNYVLAHFIKEFLTSNKHMFEFVDWNKLKKYNTLQELDESVLIKVFKYSSLDDYYQASSCSRCVKNVTIPFLVVNAEDDLVCPKKTIAFAEINSNPNVALVLTKYGGHMGWASAIPLLTKDTLVEKKESLPFFKHDRFDFEPYLSMTNSWSEQVAIEYLQKFIK